MSIETVRLRLVPYSPAQLLALAERPEQFEQVAGVPAAEGLRDFVVSDDVSPDYLNALRKSGEPDPWRHGFAVVHRECRAVIGNAAFKGPPDAAGMVEIGYGIVPGFEGHGYATEAAGALVGFAFDSGLVRVVLAHTRPESHASMRVLTKCGFHRIGEVVDPVDGLVWRWERLP